MPQWLCNQLMRAYQKKDIRQIRLLNDCWFFTARSSVRAKKIPSQSIKPFRALFTKSGYSRGCRKAA